MITGIEEAGDDKTLDKIENFNVNITNLTTADYALASQEGGSVDEDEKLLLSALIKIVVDGKGDDAYELPSGVTSTLDLVDDSATAEAFELQVNADNPDLIAKVTNAIINDPSVVSNDGIVGTWIINLEGTIEDGILEGTIGDEITVLTFTDSGHIIHIDTATVNNDDCGQAGYELGTYEWEKSTGSLTVTINEDTDGCVGLHDETELGQPDLIDQAFVVTGNTLTIGPPDDRGTGQRIISDSNPLVGGYIIGSLDNSYFWHQIFFDNNHEITLLHTGTVGVDASSYNWDSTTGITTFDNYTVTQVGEYFEEQVYKPVGDRLLYKDSDYTTILKRTHNKSNQLYLTKNDVIGSYSVVERIADEQGTYQITLNEDGTGIDDDADEVINVTWRIIAGQLIITHNDLGVEEKSILSPTNISNGELSLNSTRFTLIGNDGGSETDLVEYLTETWTRN